MWKTKGGVYVALLMMLVMIIFINANPSRATSLVPKMSNNIAGSDCSSIHDCLIADDQSLEFLLGSEVDPKPHFVINKALNGSKPIVNCGRNTPHATCLPGSNNATKDEHCFGPDGEEMDLEFENVIAAILLNKAVELHRQAEKVLEQ
ncbi:hypothetical protein EZV62_006610 [Acer yangbiense]|uniref:Pectinesterase inhibitor domain-containing protein n=1 Tax=Acer yangbiense TaxID=1000413 RepID=A0A5C7I831_9ROSI|nr:hypothetical protein EZV62_006610 [Acer yangbiense]